MPGRKSPAKIAQLKALHASNAKDQPDENPVPLIFSETTNTSTSTRSNTRNKASIASLKSELEGKVQEIDGLKETVSKAPEDAEVQESKISSHQEKWSGPRTDFRLTHNDLKRLKGT
ncbi:hypothetical protein BT96DRAFT_989557 [Gymnopus androsaceus JB14]|uniref:Uncharacterized protein n=1 Tax=Gymnopus androsaceus JB14 TaxID=1447944 RepID=A0A6A4HY22_9AGAR|nr:hypothetical protein BT96DRAFT_989557 [Gymnopus androsaceus JB14]